MIETMEFDKWASFLMQYKFALDEIRTRLEILDQEYKIAHESNPIEHVKSRIKKPVGIIAKMEKMDLMPTIDNAREHIMDIAGIRVVCSFVEDIYYLVKVLSNQKDIQVLQIKDYIKNPKVSGYRSLHMIVTIPVFLSESTVNVPVEIQIRTTAMDTWASLEHKLYYKLNGNAPEDFSARLKSYAIMAHDLDEKMQELKNMIEEH